MAHGILLHEPDDDVGVAVRDIRSGVDVDLSPMLRVEINLD